MLVRIILFVILFFVSYTLVNALLRLFGRYLSSNSSSSGSGVTTNKAGGGNNASASMVQCCQCGTYVPESEIIQCHIKGENRQFCSRECLQKSKNNKP